MILIKRICRNAYVTGQVGIFYVIFFSILASIFCLQMYLSLDKIMHLDKPFYRYSTIRNVRSLSDNDSFLRSNMDFYNPGIGFKPKVLLSTTTSPIIWINETVKNVKSKRYVRAITDFLQEYKKNRSNYDLHCDQGRFRSYADSKSPCFFDIKSLGNCSKPPYGYGTPFQPCIMIKFNRRIDWIPYYYTQSSKLPRIMPRFLQDYIKKSAKPRIWLSCEGAHNVDKEHVGQIEYIPGPEFPIDFFPYVGQDDYLSPMVALRFKNLTPNRLVTMQCTVWAFNIKQNPDYYLDFQIMIGKIVELTRAHFKINQIANGNVTIIDLQSGTPLVLDDI